MKKQKLLNSEKLVLVDELFVAENFIDRGLGLIPRKTLLPTQGLLLRRANSIHTFFMAFSIDCIFMNSKNQVVALKEDVKPRRLIWPIWRALHVIEVSAGKIKSWNLKLGDQLYVVG